ncbi:HD domain-containing protein [Dissulfurirhabdus thermomarina]|uniref:HD domain-containing protein n=1 Tax=Dissulfurirhabdus thermomarina TaxID=1765737 RepID=A0A6N9TJS3_DISTH|nr:HD domain-containing phosphohydrolase [Dissulfurirhabdus thermomarina]NDY41511.1 HD domain-containing protein [Dissulfurirhabdus thermomarina]NMX22970.1 HD domain-containing protein [Dissulfurirhabdus thermomarina]
MSVPSLAILLAAMGFLFLAASVLAAVRIRRGVPGEYRRAWDAVMGLIGFFLAGYAVFIAIEARPVRFPLALVTGAVFFAGAVFVFLVVDLTRRTVARILAHEAEIARVNADLLRQNEALEREMAARERAEVQARVRLQHLAALHAIDMMITSSLDLRVTLDVLLDQVMPLLGADAVDVLLLSAITQDLEYEAGRGFRGAGIQRSRERLGEGSAGRAALDRRLVHVHDLHDPAQGFRRFDLVRDEGFECCYAVPLIAKGQVKGVLEVFFRRHPESDPEWFDLLEALAAQAAIAIDNATLFNELQRSNAELILAYDSTIEGWSRALELRDRETQGHTERVVKLTLRLARAFGMRGEELVHVRRGALLHDIGKMAVPDSILMKEGPLTDEEWEVMRRHPALAFEMLSPIAYLRPALDIPYCHHEKWDGTGYPRGLKGPQIPLAARIFAVADTWDALRSERRYHEAWSEAEAREHIRSLAGTHFDPEVVRVFLEVGPGEDREAEGAGPEGG